MIKKRVLYTFEVDKTHYKLSDIINAFQIRFNELSNSKGNKENLNNTDPKFNYCLTIFNLIISII